MVVGQLEPVAVARQAHEDVDRLLADRHPAALLEAERLVEGDGAVDVADPVAGVDELHAPERTLRPMIVERSMRPDWLSNTYLVAAAPGGDAFLVDAGGPVAPLLAKADEHGLTVTHVLLTHHHHDHVAELDEVLERLPGRAGARPPGRARRPARRATCSPDDELEIGGLTVRALHTPGHTRGCSRCSSTATSSRATRCSRAPSAASARPGSTTYADLKRSIMDVLLALPPETTIRPGHTDPTTVADELETNAFVRIWRGLDPEGAEPCTALGEPATLVLLGDDYDGGHKAWVRWPDGSRRHRAGLEGEPLTGPRSVAS